VDSVPTLTYLGHSAFLVEGGGKTLAIDPFLTGNPLAKTKAEDIRCDYVLLTHGHDDHVGDAETLVKNNGAAVIAPNEVAVYLKNKGADAFPMHIGGAADYPFGRVKLTVAHHGSTYITDDEWVGMGQPAGFLITIEGKTLYHAGDTGLTLDMKLLGDLNEIDVALLPIGDNFTMGMEDAAVAAEFLRAELSIPMHYNTFPPIEADPEKWVSMVEAKGLKARVLDVGGSLEY
jgi:L-ascorbate metabolism protein UlaG (beta-lactamase superfamily)